MFKQIEDALFYNFFYFSEKFIKKINKWLLIDFHTSRKPVLMIFPKNRHMASKAQSTWLKNYIKELKYEKWEEDSKTLFLRRKII